MNVAEFKEELWGIVVEFGEPILMASGLDKEAREELLKKISQKYCLYLIISTSREGSEHSRISHLTFRFLYFHEHLSCL